MDKEAAKTAIRDEMARRVTFSAGPEVFRRFLRSAPDVVEAALAELVAEGVLKQTDLRVGRIYAFPANIKPSHDYLADQLAKLAEAPARSARPAHAPAPTPRAAVAATPAGPPRPAAATSAPAAFSGPVRAKKKSEMTPEELAAAGAASAAPAPGSPSAAAAPPPGAFTGPVRAKKKSEMTPEELAEIVARAQAAVAARRAAAPSPAPAAPQEPGDTSTSPPPAAPPPGGYTGPVRARKKSEMPAEQPPAEDPEP